MVEVIDGIAMKDRREIVPVSPQEWALKQLHINHMGIEKTCLLEQESVY